MPSLVFKDAEQARDSICIEDQRRIRDLYAEWADKVAERAEFYEKKTTASSYWQQQQMLELERQLRSQSMQIHKEIESGSKSSMHMIADSVVGCNAEFLKALGFKEDGINAAFTSIPNRVVSNIVTGQIYEGGWSLSKAIWTDNQKTLSDIYSIVAQGRAMNMSAYEVSKMLERYVNPAKAKMWNLKMADGVRIYKKSVDYNAQRLVRTLNQHAYQQSIIQVVKDNPFIPGIYWRSNGSRVCPICIDRDGNFYKWNELPMDHPNGMCTMEPAVDMDKTIDQLADWIKEPDGTYPEIDKFAEKLGYEPKNKMIVQVNNSNQKTNSEHYVVQGKDITSTWKRRSDQFDFEIEDAINAQGFDGLPRVVSADEFEKYVQEANGGKGFIGQRAYGAPNGEILSEYKNELYEGKWYVDCSVGGCTEGQGMYCAANYSGNLSSDIMHEMDAYSKGSVRYAYEAMDDKTFYGINEKVYERKIEWYKEQIEKGMSSNEASYIINSHNDEEFAKKYAQDLYSSLFPQSRIETLTLDPSAKIITEKELIKMKSSEPSEQFRKMDNGVYAALKGYDAINAENKGTTGRVSYTVILNRTKVIFKGE